MRLDVLDKVKELCRKASGGRYHVRRGTVAWNRFPFQTHKFGLSIEIPEEDDAGQVTTASLTLTLMTRMPDHAEKTVDDTVLEKMRDDLRWIIASLIESTVSGDNDALLLSIEPLPCLEIADTEGLLQGVTRTIVLEY